MSTGKTNLTSTQFAAKKLLGKAHTSNLKGDVNESIPSNVSLPSEGIFAESIPNDPGTDFYTLYSASSGDPATVERVYLDVVAIADTVYDANVDGGGGDEASGNGTHGYYLKLPSNYETTSSNPNAGSDVFTNGKRIYDSRGGLQLVPPLISNANPNKYFLKLYKGDASNPANEITSGDTIDWQVDYYAGTIFVQDYSATTIPVSASAYLYVGKYLGEKISTLSVSSNQGTDITVKDEGSDLTTAVTSFDFVGAGVTATDNGSGEIIVTITGNGSGSAITVRDEGTLSTTALTSIDFVGAGVNASSSNGDITVTIPGGAGYSRRAVSTTITASVSDKILGVSGSSAIDIRLPSAGDYQSGQYFTVKDESGAANIKNITIRPSGSQTIDGLAFVTLESPYSAVNIYSDGTSKFFIY